jgi:hypothetical protein
MAWVVGDALVDQGRLWRLRVRHRVAWADFHGGRMVMTLAPSDSSGTSW